MESVKVGVIGTGHLGRFHALNYLQLPQTELVGVYDTDQEKSRKIAEECKCRSYPDLDSLLKDVQAVSIAVPTDKHFEIAGEVLSRDIHCLIEKPITETVTQAETLVRMAAVQHLVLHTGHIERYNPAVLALKGLPIQPAFIEAHRLAPFKPRGIEVSVILDLMIHDIDIVLSMMTTPLESVAASGVAVVSDTIDIANARLKFADGCVANLTASRISQKTMRKMRLFQKDTYITIDFQDKEVEIYALGEPESDKDFVLGEIGVGDKKRKVLLKKPDAGDHNALLLELETFIRAVRGEKMSGVSGRAGREALAVAVEILRQIRS
ncbi:Gfo/Idh/MocA family oxidoreductase [bacterium]|nr:Gfo/Idh/MocA family oxidoreductase [bacterium]